MAYLSLCSSCIPYLQLLDVKKITAKNGYDVCVGHLGMSRCLSMQFSKCKVNVKKNPPLALASVKESLIDEGCSQNPCNLIFKEKL